MEVKMLIQPNSKLLFIGDSITDCDRQRPIAEADGNALGNGYVSLVNALLGASHPEYRIRIVNVGSSGNTVRELEERWQTDVLEIKPDWLSIMIGINDVWRQFDTPLQTEGHVNIREYENTLERLILKTRPVLKGLILMSPFFIEPGTADPMRSMMDDYGNVVNRLASKHQAIFVDTQAAFNNILKTMHPMSLAWDRVHPGLTGHMVLAKAFLNSIEFAW